MTMSVGFLCRDGVVIGADRQVTGANYTFPECKLSAWKWKNGHGILAYSGERDLYHSFFEELNERLHPDAILDTEDAVRDALKECLRITIGKKEVLLTLFGFWLDGLDQRLFLANADQRITRVNECEVIGYGDSPLARFLMGKFRDVPHWVTVHQARIYAVYFIAQAKKYDGQYVGDGIDVYSLDRSGDGGQRCIRVLDAGRTGAWEDETNLMHYWMDVLFSNATNKDGEMPLEQFMERLKQFRQWAIGEPKS